MKILVIAPHPDDECIGCGGSVVLHAKRNDDIAAVFLTSGELGLKKLPRETAWETREAEAKAACRVLGIGRADFLRLPDWQISADIGFAAKALQPIVGAAQPELIYLPHPAEWHPDHRATLSILEAVLNGASVTKPRLLGYEVWTPLAEYQHVEDISSVMPTKLAALREHHSQILDLDYVRAIAGLNAYRGVMAGRCEYAEVFQDLSFKT